MTNRELIGKIVLLSSLHRHRISKASMSCGLYYGQSSMLSFITDNTDCTQSELAKKLHISEASAATSLKRLEKAGYIIRKPDENDSRKKRIAATQKGKAILHKFGNLCDETDSMLFDGFSEDERNLFYNLVSRLTDNINEDNLTLNECLKILDEQDKKRIRIIKEQNGGNSPDD